MASDCATSGGAANENFTSSDEVRLQPGDANAHLDASARHLLSAQPAGSTSAEMHCRAAERYLSNAAQLGGQDPEKLFAAACRLQNASQHALAALGFRMSVRIDPAHVGAHARLGIACRALGDLPEAIKSHESAIELDSSAPESFVNLGNVYREQGEFAKSLECAERALALAPQFAPAHNLKGLAFSGCRQEKAAEESHLRAIELDPGNADYLNNLALLYNHGKRFEMAEGLFGLALQLDSANAAIHNNVGKCFKDQEKLDQAGRHYRQVAALVPDEPLLELRSETLWPTIFPDHKSMIDAESRLHSVCRKLVASARPTSLTELINCAEMPPFGLQFLEHNIRPTKEVFAEVIASRLSPEVHLPQRRKVPQVVMVVTRNHEGIFLRSLRGVIDRLPLAGYELTVVASRNGVDRVRKEITNSDVRVVASPDRADDVVQTIAELRPDVLYYWEVGTDMLNYFLPFHRLAPVQMTSWGVQVTTGIPTIDHYLSSELVEPENAAEHYSENLLLAPSFLTYQFPQAPVSPESCRKWASDRRLYVMAQNSGKLHVDFDRIVIDILRGDDQGVFLTTARPQMPEGKAYLDRMAAQAPDICDRIRLLGRLPREDYKALIESADVLLDPLHFGGVNSTYDGLSCGKPIVTCPSEFHRGRYTAACLRRVGADVCIANSPSEYVTLAHRLAKEVDFRHHVSAGIAASRGELFEDATAVQSHEQMFQRLIEIARDG